MTETHIRQAMRECELGNVQIQARKKQDAFLYNKKWYPIKAIGKRAFEIANEIPPGNTHEMTMRLAEQLGYLRFSEIEFIGRRPISMTEPAEILKEVKKLSKLLNDLTT